VPSWRELLLELRGRRLLQPGMPRVGVPGGRRRRARRCRGRTSRRGRGGQRVPLDLAPALRRLRRRYVLRCRDVPGDGVSRPRRGNLGALAGGRGERRDVPNELGLRVRQLLPGRAGQPVRGDLPALNFLHVRLSLRRRRLQTDSADARVRHRRWSALLRGALPRRCRLPSSGRVHVGRALHPPSLLDVSPVLELRGRQRGRSL
jgi:hypothetical protein